MANIKGSKDGQTWEEMVREDKSLSNSRFSDQQALKNLILLMEWCGDKITELKRKIEIGTHDSLREK